jgi:hypothetical protein
MNALIVFFFIAMILEDFLFEDGVLLKYLFRGIFIYWIFYYIMDKSCFHNVYKKLAMASYSQSYDPTIYVKLKFQTAKAKEYIENLEKKTGKKISITMFFAKCCGEVLKKYPEFNQALKYGAMHDKKTVDISLLVDVGGKV